MGDDLQKASISNFACKEHVMASGRSAHLILSLFYFLYFFTKIYKIQVLHTHEFTCAASLQPGQQL